ncbi:MAG: ubiquinone/menaquinone biosynthesis methyltransferase [Candidatus Omnitrophota bacterium]|nr:ubiquinone/menaquinone biosynthesis methyltransferase [Candidatus Omnitrophota bacterium]
MSKENFIHKLFDTITPGYDCFNRIASMGLDQAWRRKTIDSLNLQPGMRVLDLAAGTGDLSVESVFKMLPLGIVVACDLSHPMLCSAAGKWARHPVAGWHLRYAQGRAEQLPFPENSFNAATIGFALRNVSDLGGTFRELRRVLRPGGRVALLEFGRPRNLLLRVGHWLWLTLVLPPLGLLTTGKLWPFLYLRRSILGFLAPEEVLRRLKEAGFSIAETRPMTGGTVRLYTAQRP